MPAGPARFADHRAPHGQQRLILVDHPEAIRLHPILTPSGVGIIYICASGFRLECVSKCREMQFRADLAAFQGDFPQA